MVKNYFTHLPYNSPIFFYFQVSSFRFQVFGIPPSPTIDYLTLPPQSLGGSSCARAALQVAIDEMRAGARELGGNNRGPFVVKYLNGLAPEGSSWCAAFVSWCYAQHPGGIPFSYDLSARKLRSQFTGGHNSRLIAYQSDSGSEPSPGDLVFWWRGQRRGWQGHVGLVHHVRDGILYTIEGNRGIEVRGSSYILKQLTKSLGFGRVLD